MPFISFGYSRGQLGHGSTESEEQPRLVEAVAGVPMAAVSAGGWHSASVSSEFPEFFLNFFIFKLQPISHVVQQY